MAGAGYLQFVDGQVLTAAQVNTYLMEQAVMVFATATARSTALPSPSEGMVTYRLDGNIIEYYDGSAWVTVGSEWNTGKNAILNSDFSINQRAFTSTTTTGTYGFDRWVLICSGGTNTYSAQTFTLGSAPVAGYESANYARVISSGQSATTSSTILRQNIESVRTFANTTVTVSFWARASAGTPKVAVELTQSFGSGGSPSADVNTYAGQVTLSTAWTRFSVTVAVPSISGKTIGTTANTSSLILNLWTSAGSDFNSRTGSLGIQSTTIDFWGVQIERGSAATTFTIATGTIEEELAACQRYYWRNSAGSAGQTYAVGQNLTTTLTAYAIQHPVVMRVPVTSVDYSTLAVLDVNGNNVAVTAMTILGAGTLTSYVRSTVAAGLVAGNAGTLSANNNTAAYLGLSAEF